MARTLRLTGYERTAHELAYRAEIAGRSFTTRFRWDSIDLLELERRFGGELLRSLYFHAIAFDLNRLISLEPEAVDFGPFQDLVTDELVALWRRIFDGVWAQWRYEHDLPGWRGPAIRRSRAGENGSAAARGRPSAPRADPGPRRPRTGADDRAEPEPAQDAIPTLLFCGGGKDSLLAAGLLEEAGEPFDSFAYSHSLYGDHAAQHRLIGRLLDHCRPRRRRRLRIFDDFRPSPAELEAFGVRTVTAAETPSALFLALPLALAHGYSNLAVAHEKSADHGNLVWSETGEEVNHQWGKSLEAERLLGDYVADRLLPGVRYFSLLKPLYDAVIFPALARHLEALPDAHSCNVAKPWCRRCAKCVYVFLGYAAWLPRALVERSFGENLFDVEENLAWFGALLGVDGHLPFECVGRLEESRLFLALAARRGWSGIAIERFAGAVAPAGAGLFEARGHPHRIPAALAERVVPLLVRRAGEARRLLAEATSG